MFLNVLECSLEKPMSFVSSDVIRRHPTSPNIGPRGTNKIVTRGRVLATLARDDQTSRGTYDVHYTGATTDRRGYVGWLAKRSRHGPIRSRHVAAMNPRETVPQVLVEAIQMTGT